MKQLKATKQRQVIFEELRETACHPTADELYDRVRKRLPRISLATVYRNLELMAANGSIRKLEVGGKQSRFDGNASQHHHVRCVGCGRIDDVHCILPAEAEQAASGNDAFRVLTYHIEFFGLCRKCRKQRNNCE